MRWLAMSLSIVVIVAVVVVVDDDVGFELLAEALHKRNTLHMQIERVCAILKTILIRVKNLAFLLPT